MSDAWRRGGVHFGCVANQGDRKILDTLPRGQKPLDLEFFGIIHLT